MPRLSETSGFVFFPSFALIQSRAEEFNAKCVDLAITSANSRGKHLQTRDPKVSQVAHGWKIMISSTFNSFAQLVLL